MDISEPNYLTEGHWDWKPMWDPVNNEDIVFFRSHDSDYASPNSISVVNINDPNLEVHDVTDHDKTVRQLSTNWGFLGITSDSNRDVHFETKTSRIILFTTFFLLPYIA